MGTKNHLTVYFPPQINVAFLTTFRPRMIGVLRLVLKLCGFYAICRFLVISTTPIFPNPQS